MARVTTLRQTINTIKGGTFYYGWIVLALAFGIGFFTAGVNQAFGIFVRPMTDEFGWSRANLSLAVSIFAIVSAIVPPIAGWFSDRFGPRFVLTLGVGCNALGMVLMSQVTSLLHVYLVYGLLIGMGFGFSGHAAITALLSRWFIRRRGFALSVAATGLGVGQLALAPFMTYLIIGFSWQTAFVVTGVLSAVLVPMAWIALNRREPAHADEDAPMLEPGEKAAEPVCITNAMIREDLDLAWSTRSFWMIASGFMSCGFTIYFLTAHMVPLAVDRGISAGQAGTALGIAGGMVIGSNIVVGMLSDRVSRKYVLAGLYGLRALSVVLLLFVSAAPALYLFAVLFGLSRANAPVVSATIIDIYGRRAVGTLVGYLTMFHQLFAAAGAFFGGLVYDMRGSYDLMLYIAIAILVNGTIASLVIDERRLVREGEDVVAIGPRTAVAGSPGD